jgi:hypothetical protein
MVFSARARLLVATFWVGSIWTIGYVVAPTLFASLSDKALAGTLAGNLFRIEAWISVCCGLILVMLARKASDDVDSRKRDFWLVVGMLLCTLIGYFALQPFMAALRAAAGPGGVMASDAKAQFGILHGVSSLIYLIQSLLGVILILRFR